MLDFSFFKFEAHLNYLVSILRKFYVFLITRSENIALLKKARFFFISVYLKNVLICFGPTVWPFVWYKIRCIISPTICNFKTFLGKIYFFLIISYRELHNIVVVLVYILIIFVIFTRFHTNYIAWCNITWFLGEVEKHIIENRLRSYAKTKKHQYRM